MFLLAPKHQHTDPCNSSPCGPNALCRNGICSCLSKYQGDPYTGCRPECIINAECPNHKACILSECQDPCMNICGQNAVCNVVNHIPICSCPEKTTGDSFVECHAVRGQSQFILEQKNWQPIFFDFYFDLTHFLDPIPERVCSPSPCGPNSECREVNGIAVCSCLLGYIGNPPTCHPECVVNADCPLNRACINQKCSDPCPGTCGLDALCQIVNHNPVCSCPPHFTGDPFVRCIRKPGNKLNEVVRS